MPCFFTPMMPMLSRRASGTHNARWLVRGALPARTPRLGRNRGISGNYHFNDNGDPQSVGYYVVEVNAQNWGANKVVKRLLGRPPG